MDRFIGHEDAAFGEQILDVSEAEAEPVSQTAWLIISDRKRWPRYRDLCSLIHLVCPILRQCDSASGRGSGRADIVR